MANKKKTAAKPKAAAPKSKAAVAKPKEATAGERIGAEVLGVVLIAVGVLLAVYLFSKQPSGVGSFLHTAMFAISGLGAYALPPLLVVLGVLTIASRKAEPVPGGKISVIVTIVLLIALVHLVLGSVPYTEGESNVKMGVFLNQTYRNAIEPAAGASRGGGVVGGFICYLLFILGGKALCYVVLIGGLVICALLITRLSIRAFAIKLHDNVQHVIERDSDYDDYDEDDETAKARDEALREAPRSAKAQTAQKSVPIDPVAKPRKDGLSELTLEDKPEKPGRKPRHIPFDEAFTVPEPEKPANPALDALEVLPQSGSLERRPRRAKAIKPEELTTIEAPPIAEREEPGTANPPQPPEVTELMTKQDAEKPRPLRKSREAAPASGESAAEGEAASGLMPARAPENYVAPGIDCLIQPKQTYAKSTDNPQEMGQLLVEVLESFNIQTKIVNIVVGPSVTRFELQPAPGIRVNKITALSNDIALALAAQRVRIEAPIPGKAAVGVEIPNKDAATVLLRDIIESDPFESAKSPITMALGKDIGGKVVVSDLGKMPHMLIAGATGSGKSVCINAIIVSMIYKSSPADLRLILIDPKKVELSVYASLPHLLMPVVTDPKRAAGALRWACTEMDARYKSFTEKGARDLARYNDLVEPERRLYKLVVIIDELADLMMVTPDDVEESICRIAQLGRAAGIHLIVATQRPSADVITGLIKANIPSRAAFAVSSSIDSRIILDSTGAEKLLGRGDMLFHPNGAGKPTRLQCAYVSDEEVEAVMAHFSSLQSEPQFVQAAIDGMNESGKSGPSGGVFGEGKQEDELLCEGVRIVMESGQASISMIQRRLRVGYARAARLIDIMEQHGYVSGFDGSKPRKVLITRSKFAEEFGVSFDGEYEGGPEDSASEG